MAITLTILALSLLQADNGQPEGKALAYLNAEVPRWSRDHHCFSCHNNGDAARALYAAIKLGREVPAEATLDTDRWLARTEGWDKNGGDGPFSDKRLARLQFTAALGSAVEAGRVADRSPLLRAATRLAEDQADDGSWTIDGDQDQIGSPTTYGRPLATWLARETLRKADPAKHQSRVDRADAWLRQVPVESVLEASTVLLARAFDGSAEGLNRRDKALGLLKRGQSAEGGWGPFATAPIEVFDTALALLALDRHRDRDGVPAMIEKGRSHLIAIQHDDGSWTETTRPTGAESYAQRLSTSGWATMALLSVKRP